jgi:hypothetical protein
MTKLKKTARELAELIAARMISRGVRLNVLGDAVGWHAVVYGEAPRHVTKAQAEVDQIDGGCARTTSWTIAASEGPGASGRRDNPAPPLGLRAVERLARGPARCSGAS